MKIQAIEPVFVPMGVKLEFEASEIYQVLSAFACYTANVQIQIEDARMFDNLISALTDIHANNSKSSKNMRELSLTKELPELFK